MVQDPEKRFQTIMDKLYQSPKPRTSPQSGAAQSSSRKWKRFELSSRGGPESGATSSKGGLGSKEAAQQPCRPWDRGDLMRRLATFKAMTWFGKPKAVNPVNCARRGWVNVEMDTIACEACGSRLLFSTPSSWTFEQVEKAAAVFSLKLDNGHKLLCPWIDNICDELLASFPPTPASALVEAYKERCRGLLQLSALPVISQSSLDYMKCKQLDSLLEQSSIINCTFNNCVKLLGRSSEDGDVAPDVKISNLYFEAEKIIGLCGWELRLLPYIVSFDNSSVQNASRGSPSSHIQQLSGKKNEAIVIYSESNLAEAVKETERDPFSAGRCDPASTVLDCKLCGARIGLWAFDSTPRPLECFNLVDSPEGITENASITDQENKVAEILKLNDSGKGSVGKDGSMNLKLSIAGGAPPTRQHFFKPRISLPIMSRHLRVQLGLNYEVACFRDSETSVPSKLTYMESPNTELLTQKDSVRELGLVPSSETEHSLKRKRNEEASAPGRGDCTILSKTNDDVSIDQRFSGNGAPSEGREENNRESTQVTETDYLDEAQSNGVATDQYSSGEKVHNEMDSLVNSNKLSSMENSDVCFEALDNVRNSNNVYFEGSVSIHELEPLNISVPTEAITNADSSIENEGTEMLEIHSSQTAMFFKRKRDEEGCFPGEDDCMARYKVDKNVKICESLSGNEGASAVSSEERLENKYESAHVSESVHPSKTESFGDATNQDCTKIGVNDGAKNDANCTGGFNMESPNQSSDNNTNAVLETIEDIRNLGDTSTGGRISPHDEPLNIASCSEVEKTHTDNMVVPDKDIFQKPLDENASNHNAHQPEETVPGNDELAAPSHEVGESGGKIKLERSTTKAFDPIQHHRPFCPWIASTGGQGLPGWKLTLLALDGQGGSPSPVKGDKKTKFDESVDPILSVRKLFERPVSKRVKHK